MPEARPLAFLYTRTAFLQKKGLCYETNQKNLCRWTGRYDGPVPAFLRLCRSAG